MSVTKLNTITLWSTGASFNNIPANPSIWSGAVFGLMGGYNNSIMVYFESGAATSFANSGALVYVDWSPDGQGWHSNVATGAGGLLSGAIMAPTVTQLGVWNQFPINAILPYARVLIQNRTGSIISGSVYVFGDIYA